MADTAFIDPSDLRAAFSAAMSEMYCDEVPAYGALMELVADVNSKNLQADPVLHETLKQTDGLDRISDERHGAIRVGTEHELKLIRRAFALMGMFPVGYYDLSVAGIPVHSTAFRPIDGKALSKNPFRVFTSLLRLDLIKDKNLKADAKAVLAQRKIFTDRAIELIEIAETNRGVLMTDVACFIQEILQTFKWHPKTNVSKELYSRLHNAHRLIADVVSFKGPHINHLTPRTLNIDDVQRLMPERSINPKAVIEGPPSRKCPILLRQTSFKALEENVDFTNERGGKHTARFGEIEQRGIALTQKGRALYDELLNKTRTMITPEADGSNAHEYQQTLQDVFALFPDEWVEMRKQKLAYFSYSLSDKGKTIANCGGSDLLLEELIEDGLIRFDPIIYEDFLPVSAAGIFQSNLGDKKAADIVQSSNQVLFEKQLGAKVLDEFEHYHRLETASKAKCLNAIKITAKVI